MKVLLVKPYNLSDHIQPSLGLGYLAQNIRDRHEVAIVDCIKDRFSPKDFTVLLKKHRPDVLGIQCYTFDLRNVKAILQVVKETNPKTCTLVGGAHPSSAPESSFRSLGAQVDFAFAGEAELGLPVFLDRLERGGGDWQDVPGLIWRRHGRIMMNPTKLVEDLDALGFPAWDLMPPQNYPEAQHGAFFKKFPITPIVTTRGCPYKCSFCSAPLQSGRGLRHHSVDYVVRHIKLLHGTYGIREFHIVDDNFTMDKEYAKSVLRAIRDLNLDISLATPNGVRMDALDDELLSLMKQAGLYLISVAVESGSNRILKAMKKGITVEKIRECTERIRRHGIDMAGFFILGFPGETREEMQATIRFSKELGLLRANFFTYLPLPGTESYRKLEERGELKNVDWDNFYFMTAPYAPESTSRDELLRLKREAFLSFYLRPAILFKNLMGIRSVRHFLFLLRRFYHWILMSPAPQLS